MKLLFWDIDLMHYLIPHGSRIIRNMAFYADAMDTDRRVSNYPWSNLIDRAGEILLQYSIPHSYWMPTVSHASGPLICYDHTGDELPCHALTLSDAVRRRVLTQCQHSLSKPMYVDDLKEGQAIYFWSF